MIRPYHLTSHLLSLAMSFKQAFRLKIAKRDLIGYFRVAPSLCFKARLGAKMGFYSFAHKTHFHKKGFALSLILKVRDFGTRKKRSISILRLTTARAILSRFLKGKLARGLAKGTIKRATKTCNLLCNIAVKRVEWRYCTFYHPCSNLSCNKSGFCWLRKVVAKRRE